MSSKQLSKKTIFDESYLKYLKLKNLIFRAEFADSTFKNGWEKFIISSDIK